jgi:DNA-binding NtrC family response regulator
MDSSTELFTMLIADDELAVLNAHERFFSRSGYRLLLAENGAKCLNLLAANHVDLMLLDLKMPDVDGLEVLERAKSMRPNLKVIIQTGHGGIHEAVNAMRKGALDFLVKGDPVQILSNRVRQVYEIWRLEQESSALRKMNKNTFCFDALIGNSPPMQRLKNLIVRVAPTDTTVLIQGETGTGKELIAQALHYHSDRKDKPFVAVDCASISESILESELFGHEKGAFTGAEMATRGLIRSADTGTLFLDEIGEIPPSVQAKLLRTIQEFAVRPVGSTKTYQADIRIIAATNRNLLDEVACKNFRQDLYYRISTVTLTAPPLRERIGDIDLLAEHILNQQAPVHGKPVEISREAHEALEMYNWPGNIRELENVLRKATVFSESNVLSIDDMPSEMQELYGRCNRQIEKTTVAEFEKEAIKKALSLASNRKDALDMLDISEATFYRKIKKYNLSMHFKKSGSE